MNVDLLLKLCDLLGSLPREKFDFGTWASGDDLSACGTVACAAGWATTIPECELRLVVVPHGPDEGPDAVEVRHTSRLDITEHYLPLESVALAFDLTDEEARLLFMPSFSTPPVLFCGAPGELARPRPQQGASPFEVAEWIRFFIRAKDRGYGVRVL